MHELDELRRRARILDLAELAHESGFSLSFVSDFADGMTEDHGPATIEKVEAALSELENRKPCSDDGNVHTGHFSNGGMVEDTIENLAALDSPEGSVVVHISATMAKRLLQGFVTGCAPNAMLRSAIKRTQSI